MKEKNYQMLIEFNYGSEEDKETGENLVVLTPL